MKIFVRHIALPFLIVTMLATAIAQDKTKPATEAAQKWLAMVDAGHYAESWNAAASSFKEHLSSQDWQSALQKVRAPLGTVQSRVLKSAVHQTDLPNAPKGDYYVIRYATDFAEAKGTVETVVPMLEKDGTWKVSGYFIKPAQ